MIVITIITIVNGVYEPIYNYMIYMVYGRYINTPTMVFLNQQNITGGAQPGKSSSLRVPAADP